MKNNAGFPLLEFEETRKKRMMIFIVACAVVYLAAVSVVLNEQHLQALVSLLENDDDEEESEEESKADQESLSHGKRKACEHDGTRQKKYPKIGSPVNDGTPIRPRALLGRKASKRAKIEQAAKEDAQRAKESAWEELLASSKLMAKCFRILVKCIHHLARHDRSFLVDQDTAMGMLDDAQRAIQIVEKELAATRNAPNDSEGTE